VVGGAGHVEPVPGEQDALDDRGRRPVGAGVAAGQRRHPHGEAAVPRHGTGERRDGTAQRGGVERRGVARPDRDRRRPVRHGDRERVSHGAAEPGPGEGGAVEGQLRGDLAVRADQHGHGVHGGRPRIGGQRGHRDGTAQRRRDVEGVGRGGSNGGGGS
jgi:hypothetical protein